MDAPVCPRHQKRMILRRARRGKKPGSAFYGCPEYPRCHYTVDATAINAEWDAVVKESDAIRAHAASHPPVPMLPVGGFILGEPGGGARREFDRRKTRYDAERPERMLRAARRAALLAGVVFVFLLVVGSGVAILGAAVVAAATLLQAWLPPQTTEAWSTGARGEERTAEYLAPLVDDGYVILHYLKMPWSVANIDHVVIGPTGIFVIETKNIGGRLQIRGDDIRIGGRRAATVAEIERQVEAVAGAVAPVLGERELRVRAIVCTHRAELPLLRRSMRGVRLTSGRGLVRAVRDGPTVLSATEIGDLAARVIADLMPAAAPGPAAD